MENSQHLMRIKLFTIFNIYNLIVYEINLVKHRTLYRRDNS